MSMRDEVAATLAALPLVESDRAARELALTYAQQLDTVGAVRAQADKAVREAMKSGDELLAEMVTALRAKLSERDTVDRIGKNLLALLDALGGTPKARAELDKKTGGKRPAAPSGGMLAQLRSA